MSVASRIRFMALLVGAIGPAVSVADISFKERFTKNVDNQEVVVQAPDDEVLVLEPGEYVLNGRRLVISAKIVRVDGEAVIRAFDQNKPADSQSGVAATGPAGPPGPDVNCSRSGCPGSPGQLGETGIQGVSGARAEVLLIDIQTLQGSGSVKLVASGQTGGKGQKGGKGGTGGRGGNGAQRSCGGAFGLDTRSGPGDGGTGGAGGPGGPGGVGGVGGPAADIVLRSELKTQVDAGKVTAVTDGGLGGAGGDPGDAGDAGQGGSFGHGNSCGGGGTSGNTGGPGRLGDPGQQGISGSRGSVTFSTFVFVAPAPVTAPSRAAAAP